MLKTTTDLDRREFIKTSAFLGAGISLPFFFNRSLAGQAAAGAKTRPDQRILVVLELRGGNDGLNTVVPYGDDAYYRMRPGLGLKSDSLLRVDDYLGFNEGLKGLKSLYDDGLVAVVNGVGYPNPNRSHFRSMEIWQTATDSEKYETQGWVGKYHDLHPDDNPDPLCGVAINSELPLGMKGQRGLSVAFENPQTFRWTAGQQGDTEERFRQINFTDRPHDRNNVDPVHLIRAVTRNIIRSSDRVQQAARRGSDSKVEYPNNPLSRNLRTVAELIAGGLPTNVYNVAYGGFDTHANQKNQHQNLMSGFGDSVAAFQKDLKQRGLTERVVVICFSEFGRRAQENASGGTDHGTAGPMFLIGKAVKSGLHGVYPSLTELDGNKDLIHTVDFRAVYADVLRNWFLTDPAKVLRHGYAPLDLINPKA